MKSISDKHQTRIALQTLRMTDAGAEIMGGMTKVEARSFLKVRGLYRGEILAIDKVRETPSVETV